MFIDEVRNIKFIYDEYDILSIKTNLEDLAKNYNYLIKNEL